MPNQFDVIADLLTRVVGAPVTLGFGLLLVVHIPAGMTGVVTGAVALLSRKQRGRHPLFGEVYFWALAVVFVTATGMAFMRWEHSAYLFVLGCIAFVFGSSGYAARKRRWPGWLTTHMIGMSLSYIVLLTAFYVDNGPKLPTLGSPADDRVLGWTITHRPAAACPRASAPRPTLVRTCVRGAAPVRLRFVLERSCWSGFQRRESARLDILAEVGWRRGAPLPFGVRSALAGDDENAPRVEQVVNSIHQPEVASRFVQHARCSLLPHFLFELALCGDELLVARALARNTIRLDRVLLNVEAAGLQQSAMFSKGRQAQFASHWWNQVALPVGKHEPRSRLQDARALSNRGRFVQYRPEHVDADCSIAAGIRESCGRDVADHKAGVNNAEVACSLGRTVNCVLRKVNSDQVGPGFSREPQARAGVPTSEIDEGLTGQDLQLRRHASQLGQRDKASRVSLDWVIVAEHTPADVLAYRTFDVSCPL